MSEDKVQQWQQSVSTSVGNADLTLSAAATKVTTPRMVLPPQTTTSLQGCAALQGNTLGSQVCAARVIPSKGLPVNIVSAESSVKLMQTPNAALSAYANVSKVTNFPNVPPTVGGGLRLDHANGASAHLGMSHNRLSGNSFGGGVGFKF